MRIKKKNVLKESYLINEAILLDQLTHIKPDVKKVLKLLYKKYVPKNDESFRWWNLSAYDIERFLDVEMGIPLIHAVKISRFFVKYGEKIFSDVEEYVYDTPVKENFEYVYDTYADKFSKDKPQYPDITFNTTINGKKVSFDEPYDVWSSYRGVTLYVAYYRDIELDIQTPIIINYTFNFNGGGENTISISKAIVRYEDSDGEREEMEFLPDGTEIDLPENDSYESFVKWMQELITNTKTILSNTEINIDLG